MIPAVIGTSRFCLRPLSLIPMNMFRSLSRPVRLFVVGGRLNGMLAPSPRRPKSSKRGTDPCRVRVCCRTLGLKKSDTSFVIQISEWHTSRNLGPSPRRLNSVKRGTDPCHVRLSCRMLWLKESHTPFAIQLSGWRTAVTERRTPPKFAAVINLSMSRIRGCRLSWQAGPERCRPSTDRTRLDLASGATGFRSRVFFSDLRTRLACKHTS